MVTDLNKTLTDQIDALGLDKDCPLIISDADEVLLQFIQGLERFLESQNLWLDLSTFALIGNIKDIGTNVAIHANKIKPLLANFFEQEIHKLDPIPGAATKLQNLSTRAQVIVLSNVPLAQRKAREENLNRSAMPYPVIANDGDKGPAVNYLAKLVSGPLFFLDDIPRHLTSAKARTAHCHCIHLTYDPRIAKLSSFKSKDFYSAKNWDEAHAFIDKTLTTHGF